MFIESVLEYENSFPDNSIVDGVIDESAYFDSKIKIAWFLKEAYSSEVEGFHIKEHYGQEDPYNSFFKNIATPTWHPIIYTSFSILNGFVPYDDMDFIRNKPTMCDVIKNVSIINANKFASKTGTYTEYGNLYEGFQTFKDLIGKQVAVLKPDIHIFCGTFSLYKPFFEITEQHQILAPEHFKRCNIFIKDGNLFLDVYHPANRQQRREEYVNEIILASSIWHGKYNSES